MPPMAAKKKATIVDEAITNVPTRARMAPRLARTTKSLLKSPKQPATPSKTVRFDLPDSPPGIRKSKRLAEKALTKSAPMKLAPVKPPKKGKVKANAPVLPKSTKAVTPAKKAESSKKKSSKVASVQAKPKDSGSSASTFVKRNVKKNASVAPKSPKVVAPAKKAETSTSKKSTKSSRKPAPSKVDLDPEEIRLLTPIIKEPSARKALASPKPTKLATPDKPKGKASKKTPKSAPIQVKAKEVDPICPSNIVSTPKRRRSELELRFPPSAEVPSSNVVSTPKLPKVSSNTPLSWPLITTEADLRFPLSAEVPSFRSTAPAKIFLRAAIDSLVVDLFTSAEHRSLPKGQLHTSSSIRQIIADDEELFNLFGSMISLPLPSSLPSDLIRRRYRGA